MSEEINTQAEQSLEKEEPKNRNYRWDPEASIAITGQEYDILRKTVDLFRGAIVFNASVITVDGIFKRMLDSGTAIEYQETEPTVGMNTSPTQES